MRDLGDWKDYFTAIILSRGEEYYRRGKVCGIYKRADGYEAKVHGYELYNVRIIMDDKDNFISASCDCPYCQSGKNCKHEAALLFALENGEPVLGVLNNTIYEKQDVSKLCSIIEGMDEDEVKSLLTSIVSDNTVAADFLYSKVLSSHPELLYKYVLNAIKMIVTDSLSFYETDMINRVLSVRLDPFIEQKKYPVEINHILFDSLQVIRRNRNYNPYNFRDVANNVSSMISRIWNNADVDSRKAIVKLYNNLIDSSLYDEIVDSFMIDVVSDSEYMSKRLSLMERGCAFSSMTLMKIMNKLGFDYLHKLNEMKKFKGQAEYYVRSLCDKYEEEGRWEEYAVLGILIIDAETIGKKLREHGLTELSIPFFYLNLDKDSPCAEDAFLLLDVLPNDKKKAEAERIVSKKKYYIYTAEILAHVADWDALLSFFDMNPLNNGLVSYENSLLSFSPERLIAVYKKRCLLMLPTKGMRKQRPSYRRFAVNLQKLSSFGGKDDAFEIASYAKANYPDRKALFRILAEYGF